MINDDAISTIELPDAPAELADAAVKCWRGPLEIDTYMPAEPDIYPTFFEKRVYQGSSGDVYPLPFHERIASQKEPHAWDAVHLENDWVRLMILPELGGRIHIGMDKTNGYDFFYRNNVIKPALVGLAGPWISGGVEFNWPQHHRPATFLPVDVEIEHEDDGAVTVWLSDHDPMDRLKGMHGIRLRPDSSVVEARARLFNRTPETQTFLWWANVAAKVGDDYQSFFPTDVSFVADHARRAMTSFPAADRPYYGADYPARATEENPDGDRIDWYKNIPVPTSYMVTDTDDDFFGGYDHGERSGFVHVADRHVAPGKKQWTWGNAEFGWAWDRNLTDTDGPYVELMAGVFTDNQPDFSFLAPGETKTFSQYWYPIRDIGPAHMATLDGAVSLTRDDIGVHVGVHAPREYDGARIVLSRGGDDVSAWTVDLAPDSPFTAAVDVPGDLAQFRLVVEHGGREVISWQHRDTDHGEPWLAVEPPMPDEVESQDELFLTGSYLEQYRHATRGAAQYWREALLRDPGDYRAHLSLGHAALRSGRYGAAEDHARAAIERVTKRVPNPVDGAPHYLLGLALLRQGDATAAYDALAKAAWNDATAAPAQLQLARLDARAGEDDRALERLEAVLDRNGSQHQAVCAAAVLLRRNGAGDEAAEAIAELLEIDPLDQWARHLAGRSLTEDPGTLLDVALEYAALGAIDHAAEVLRHAIDHGRTGLGQVNVLPLLHLHLARLLRDSGDGDGAAEQLMRAETCDATHALASRLDDVDVLTEFATASPRASAILGHWLYHVRRYEDAISSWIAALGGSLGAQEAAIVHRNLGIAMYNVRRDVDAALDRYRAARALRPDDAKLMYESDQLALRAGVSVADRLSAIEARPELVSERDDLTVVFASLLTANGRATEARDLLAARHFQPWEGGEGLVLGQWDAAHLALAREAKAEGRDSDAVALLERAFHAPHNLGEARHLLANTAELSWELGDAYSRVGQGERARAAFEAASRTTTDFLGMSEREFGPQTVYTVRALRDLGRLDEARATIASARTYLQQISAQDATIDYFATSLPTVLLFDDDPNDERDRLVETLERDFAAEDLRELASRAPAEVAD